ncbi:hypothetical protein MMC27_008870 [Xylographa pallens]|nr:hypothetical protein [Xylographa pallens]
MPGTVINVASELDVLVTVQFCNINGLTFLAQNGGNGWAITFDIGSKDVVINLSGIKQITFSPGKDQVTFQGGALVSDIVSAAYANNTRVLTGNCNCIGALGAVLGGGYGRLMGFYGFGVDNLISVHLVTSYGVPITVDANNADLWWALKGAGPNFGIVTSATMKAYPTPQASNTAWLGPLIFSEDKIEALVTAINNLVLAPPMAIFMYYATTGAPAYEPIVIALPFYVGTEAAGRAAFASILAIGPEEDLTAVTPYDQWNAGSGSFCVPGDRKVNYGAGFNVMNPTTWRAIWTEYTGFLAANPGTGNSTILVECYSLAHAQSIPASDASFPLRNGVRFNGVATAWYSDASLDPVAERYGSTVRDLWRATEDLPRNLTYINFAYGDESLSTVYGASLPRLQVIKEEYDPFGRFDQWFPLLPSP